jgi:integrase
MAKVAFTAGRVSSFKCPPDKQQAFLWDATAPGLGLRTTPAGKPSYIFQGVYQGASVRITIGSPSAWSIPNAQAKARELQRQIDEGKDPRHIKRAAEAQAQAVASTERSAAVLVDEVWTAYLAERKPHWGDRHYQDHVALAKAGGEKAKRGTNGRGVTIPGPIHSLLGQRLVDLTPEVVEAWAAKESKTRPTYGRLAWRCLKAFLNWCSEHPDFKAAVPVNPAKTKKARQAFGKPAVKTDALLKEQLPAWFKAVRELGNPTTSAYLQVLLLTGARPGEVLRMRREDLNEQWKGLTIRDKVEGERVIPLTPYVHSLIAALPRRGPWVFAALARADGKTGTHISFPHKPLAGACEVAGIGGLTLHGLRRSFKSLTEWLEIPAGVVAQIMGHKPSATAEKHYTVRPLDLLRVHHERIETWVLEQGGVEFDRSAQPGVLRAVA